MIFSQNDDFKCWIQHAGNEDFMYLSILPLWESDEPERKRIVEKIIAKYRPLCQTE